MNEAANSVWSTRQLDRQISTLYYDRLLGSHDKKIVTDEAIAKYSVLNDAKQIFASKYKLTLPTEDELQNELNKARKRLELENTE